MKTISALALVSGLLLSVPAFPQNSGQTSTTQTTKVKTKHKKHKNSTTTESTTTTKENPK